MRALLLLTAVVLVLCGCPLSWAQDRDLDGLPDAVEARLGTNPDLDEGLVVVLDDGVAGKGDKSRPRKAPDVDKVYMAHVAGDRYVWKVTFASDYPKSGTVFHLYVDMDDNKATGRQDADWVRGVDVMYSAVDANPGPRIITPAVRVSPAIPVRMIIEGNAIYVADDIKPAVREGKTHIRMYLLSHMKDDTSDSDTTDWVYAEVPMHPERAVPGPAYAVPEGFEALTMPDFAQLTYSLWQDKRTRRLLPSEATNEGFTLRMNDDFEGSGAVSWKCPLTGSYRLGLILHEDPTTVEALELRVDGKPAGVCVGTSGTARDVLHFTIAPLPLTQGQVIQLRTPTGYTARFQGVCLLADKPTVPALEIENLTAWHVPDEPGQRTGRVLLAWVTNRPTDATIQYALAGPEATEQTGEFAENRGYVNNHAVLLPADLKASAYQLTITCKEPPQETYAAQTVTRSLRVWRDAQAHRRNEGLAQESPAKVLRIPLTVQERTGQGRESWPVTSGVPLPPGALMDATQCRLEDANGTAVPVQLCATSWWPDGSVKWLRLDFLARTQANGVSAYTLITGATPTSVSAGVSVQAAVRSNPAAGEPLGVLTAPVSISTGRLVMRLGAGGFTPFAEVAVDGKRVSTGADTGFEITDAAGKVYSSAAAAPEQILLEESGPLHAVLCVRGKFAAPDGTSFLRYLCRLHFWAGQPWVRVVFSLDNDLTTQRMTNLTSLQIRVPADLSAAKLTIGAGGGALPLRAGDALVQDNDDHFATAENTGKRADGWVLADGPQPLAVVVRDFWQLYPKGLSGDARGLKVQLLPALPPSQFAQVSDDDRTKLYFWCDGGKYRVRAGVRITTEFAVDYAPAIAADKNGVYTTAAAWQAPLFAACTPEWYCSTGALGEIFPRTPGRYDVYDRNLDTAFSRFLQRRERIREYGFLNYGDWFGERTWNWGNGEYDTQWGLAAAFVRTGNLDMLWSAEAMERHKADTDTVHYSSSPGEVGAEWEHCIGHTGGYFDNDWKNMGWFNSGGHANGHTWCQGHLVLYELTGERRFLETGRAVADWVAARTNDFRFGAEREAGWGITALMGAYNTLGDPRYLNASRIITDSAIWTLHPERAIWGHFQDPNECKHEPRCWGCKPFMTGTLLHGMSLYDQAQPREEVRQTIRRAAAGLWREMYVPKDMGFRYSGCTTFTQGQVWTISLVGDGLAYGCWLDPQHANLELLQEATSAFLHRSSISDFGKGLSQGLCFMPYMLYRLDKLGLTNIPEPPPPPGAEQAMIRPAVSLLPGETRTFAPVIRHSGDAPADCVLTVTGTPWCPTILERKWQAPRGISAGPAITITAPADARAGDRQTVAVRVKLGNQITEVGVTATVVEPRTLGDRIGWVTGDGDPLRIAAEGLGVKPQPIADLRAAANPHLEQYKTIIVGSEAHTKNFGNIRESTGNLEAWVAAGGRLIVGQLNDDQWQPAMLPLDLILSDAEDQSAEVLVPGHPLFSRPYPVGALDGVVSYDTVVWNGPGWTVLQRNRRGGPAVLEAKVGAGTVLVVLPSYDRVCSGTVPADPEHQKASTAFLRNLLAYAGYSL